MPEGHSNIPMNLISISTYIDSIDRRKVFSNINV